MEVSVYSRTGSELSEKIELADAVFNQAPHEHAMYQAVQAQLAHSRQGTHASKNRKLVSGGGIKPFRQKGTGRARAGTSRSPLWRGGGRVFGPTPHEYAYRLPKKVKTLARISALSYLARKDGVRVIEDFEPDAPKTKTVVGLLQGLNLAGKKVLIAVHETSNNLLLACRNIPAVTLKEGRNLSTYDILDCDYLVIHKSAVEDLNKLGEL